MRELKVVRLVPGQKLSHDTLGGSITTFPMSEAIASNIPEIGVHCKVNNLVVIDVDVAGETHKKDGRAWWKSFCDHHDLPFTYVVHTRSGGFHFYYNLPVYIDPDTFSPPATLADGVDVRWNAIVVSPPTSGYAVANGTVDSIIDVPEALLTALMKTKHEGKQKIVDGENLAAIEAHRPFSALQIADLRTKLEWVQQNAELSRDQWRDGIFSLKAGVQDEEEMRELVTVWTMNQSYSQGDEVEALKIAEKADRFGPIGPGTIFSIIRQLMVEKGAPIVDTPFTINEILTKAQVKYDWTKKGEIKVEASEHNASALIGAIYPKDKLYYDSRRDLIIFNGKIMNEETLTNTMLPKIQAENFGLGMDKFRKNTVKNGIEVLILQRETDPHLEFIKNAKWDGEKRIDSFFSDYFGIPTDEYHLAVARNFWCSLAARGLHPGAQVDSMLVLEGREGIRKSSIVKVIAGEYAFTPIREDLFDNENELRKMHQAVIVELPELKGLKGKDADTVKGHITVREDHIRGLFEKRALPRPRGFVLVGTTNDYRYLTVAMGIRRFMPVRIPDSIDTIDTHKLQLNREQLFAEAKELYLSGYEYWSMPKETHRREVMKRVMQDPIQDEIDKLVNEEGVTSPMIIYKRLEMMGLLTRGFSVSVQSRIMNCIDRSKKFKAESVSLTFDGLGLGFSSLF